MVTFDGHQYTFNGKGEYVLIETPDNSFSLQGRMLPISTAQNTSSPATVYKAIVGKQNDSDTVQFEIIEGCNFIALVNGEQVVFGLINQQEFNNVVVSYLGNNTFSASFSSGAYVEAKEEVGMISVVSVSLPVSFQEIGTQGLMGSFNGNITDDLLPQSGHEPLSLNSSVRDVHEQFGITCKEYMLPYKSILIAIVICYKGLWTAHWTAFSHTNLEKPGLPFMIPILFQFIDQCFLTIPLSSRQLWFVVLT